MTVDGYDKPIDLVATMKIGPTGIDVDFTGTSGVSAFGINVPHCYTEAYASLRREVHRVAQGAEQRRPRSR
jgi:N-methylhydantoinase B